MKRILDFFSHVLTPQEKNNYKAKALHPDILTYYLVFAVLLAFFVKNLSGTGSVLGFATDISTTRLYDITNQKRSENNLPTLQYNERLSVAAQKKAQDMFDKGYWAHFAPDGVTPWSFIISSGYQYEFAGENLAKNFLFSQDVVEAWMDSPSHKENLLRADYTDVGYAVVNGVLKGEETTLVVQMFGKPLDAVAINPVAQPIAAETRPQTVEVTQPVSTTAPIAAVQSAQESTPTTQTYTKPTSTSPVILAGQSQKPFINLLPMIFSSNLVFFIFLMSAIIMDFYFAARLNVIKVGGKHIAHFIFIGFIVVGLVMSLVKGSIL